MGDCIGCGYCCTKAPCQAKMRLYASADHCPELKWNGKRHVCGLMLKEGELGERYKKELAANTGCCSGLNSWRRETIINRTSVKYDKAEMPQNPIPDVMQGLIMCLASEWISGDMVYLTMIKYKNWLMKNKSMSEDQATMYVNRIFEMFKGNKASYLEDFLP